MFVYPYVDCVIAFVKQAQTRSCQLNPDNVGFFELLYISKNDIARGTWIEGDKFPQIGENFNPSLRPVQPVSDYKHQIQTNYCDYQSVQLRLPLLNIPLRARAYVIGGALY